jgi:hypothetical protein
MAGDLRRSEVWQAQRPILTIKAQRKQQAKNAQAKIQALNYEYAAGI